jgi:ADP-dependent NAD(P)H-hydrate dehydratase / NAD(P)H-hydrate epimerase
LRRDGTPATDDARAAILRWQQDGAVTLDSMPAHLDDWDIVVDAMFGLGLARPLAGAYFAAAEALRACRSRVVAIDLPSGLDADSGAWVGGVSGVHADCTVSFLGAKPGLFTAAGVDACGCIVIDSLGVTLPAGAGRLIDPADFAALASPRRRNTHKGSFGNLLVIGGAAGMLGAPLLAARAGLRLGAGRVYVDVIGGGVGSRSGDAGTDVSGSVDLGRGRCDGDRLRPRKRLEWRALDWPPLFRAPAPASSMQMR